MLNGGPNSGKTTLIRELERLGFKVKEEQATIIIHEYIDAGIPLESVQNDPIQGAKFQDEIAIREMGAAQQFDPKDLVFFDRGAIDYRGFAKLRGLKIDDLIAKKVDECSYRHIFILDLIESEFKSTKIEAHIDNPVAVAKKQEELLIETYKPYGIPTTRVPVMPVKDRIKFILKTLNLEY